MEIDDKKLEEALSKKSEMPKISKEMEIGMHQGSINTLLAERNELIKMIQNVEQIIGYHIQRLEELGIKVQKSEK